MGESGQSRYGIMQELNNRKVNEKEKLANIERETDQIEYTEGKAVDALEAQIKDKEKSYIVEHKDTIRNLEVRLKMLKADTDRSIREVEEAITTENDTYKQNFVEWKAKRTAELAAKKEALGRYSKEQKKKIEEKKAVIVEIEAGITSLKEMSKEQKQVE